MYYFRFILAIASFILGCSLVYDLFNNGFEWPVLIGIVASFVFAHYVKPKIRKDDKPDAIDLIDLVDTVIDIPFKFVVYAIRAVGKSKDIDPVDF